MPTKTRINGQNCTQLPRLVSDGIALKGLPQTPGYPAGYGDLATAVLKGIGLNNDTVKTVRPLDCYNHSCFDSDGQFIYGTTQITTTQIVKTDAQTGAQSNYGLPTPGVEVRNLKNLSNGWMLAESKHVGDFFKLYLTKDQGATWQLVFEWDISGVHMLFSGSICEATINGSKVLLLGDYNVHPDATRVNGGANDKVRLMRSDDMGETWSEVTRWNTDGSTNNIRHIHFVKQDAVTGFIYVGTGDTDPQAAIYRWDGVSTWPINVTPANVPFGDGLRAISGRQCLRSVDLIIGDEDITLFPDTNTGLLNSATEVGIWRVSKDLLPSTLTRIATPCTTFLAHAGWMGVRLPDGRDVWVTGVNAPTNGSRFNAIIASNKARTEYKVIAAYRITEASVQAIPYGLFYAGGKLFLSGFNPSGKAEMATAVFEFTDNDFRGDKLDSIYDYDVIHPVIWLDSVGGSNANDGYRPSQPVKDLDFILTNNRITYGTRVQLIQAQTIYNGDRLPPATALVTRAGDATEFVVVQGDAATQSQLTLGASAIGNALFMFFNTTNQRLSVKDLYLNNRKPNVQWFISFGTNTGSMFRSIRCRFGGTFVPMPRFWGVGGGATLQLFSCYGERVATDCDHFRMDTSNNGTLLVEKCGINSNRNDYEIAGTGHTVTINRTVHVGADQAFITVLSGATVTLTSREPQFYCDANPTSLVLSDSAALSWANNFRLAKTNVPFGVAAAFDIYSERVVSDIPNLNALDYVY